jgi:peptide subunit release factor 1 (eRF1)
MTQNELKSLFSRPERPNHSVLSVYLNVDQSQQANRNRGFETQLKETVSAIRKTIEDPAELERFKIAAHHIEDFVSAYQCAGRALALFFDTTDGFFRHEQLDVPLASQVRWNRELYLQPLAAAQDEFERFGVVLIDNAHRRLFSVFLGEVEEFIRGRFDVRKVRHIKTVGMDHLGSASHVQRKADEQIRANLREVVKDVDWLVQTNGVHSLVFAGASEITAELRTLLPKRLAMRVIGTVEIPIEAPARDVLDAVRPLTEAHERDTEVQTVKEVVTAAAKKQKAVAGLSRTLNAVNQARVWQLIYSDGFASPGFECSKCAALFSMERESCMNCGGKVLPVRDVVERAVEHTLRRGAKIEVVKGEARASLDSAGGIAAFLNARTASL